MKKSKFTEAQVVFAIHQAETGTPVGEVCRKMGISQATFYNWKKKFGGLGTSELDAELTAWRERPPGGKLPLRAAGCPLGEVPTRRGHCGHGGAGGHWHRRGGETHVLAVETGWGESEDVWSNFIGGLKKRGMSGVRMFTSDNHPGIKAALRSHYSGIPWQRCQYHFIQNAIGKVPADREEQIREALERVWRKENTMEQATERLETLIEELADPLPDVADWLSEQAPQTLTVFQVAPASHRKRLRTTNSVERIHQELKRCSKPVRIFPNPASCLRLFGALLKEQHEDWITGRRYLTMEELEEFESNQESGSDPETSPDQSEQKLAVA